MANKLKNVIIIVLCCVIFIAGFLYFYDDINFSVTKIEIYENEEEYLVLRYRKNQKSVGVHLEDKHDDYSGWSTAFDFVDENKAIFDGQYLAVPSSMYWELFIYDGYVEIFKNGTLYGKFDFILDIRCS